MRFVAGTRFGMCLGLVSLLCSLPSGPAAAQRLCAGDCGGDATVTIDEVLNGVATALQSGAPETCAAADSDASGEIEIAELVAAVDHLLGGCPEVSVADAAFWETLHGTRNREEEVISSYRRILAEDGEDGRSWFLLGMMHMYRYGREPIAPGVASEKAKEEIQLASDALDNAVTFSPESRSIPGFRGAATFANGYTNEDVAKRELGLSQLRAAIELWPLFNSFSFMGTVGAYEPAGSALFDEAYGYLLLGLEPETLAQCTPRLCLNAGLAPSNLQGSSLLFGDMFAKGGAVEQARLWYQTAVNVGASTNYRFLSTAEARLASVEERVALYQDEDPDNDPRVIGVGVENCAVCHDR